MGCAGSSLVSLSRLRGAAQQSRIGASAASKFSQQPFCCNTTASPVENCQLCTPAKRAIGLATRRRRQAANARLRRRPPGVGPARRGAGHGRRRARRRRHGARVEARPRETLGRRLRARAAQLAHDPSDEGVDWFSDDVGDRLMEYVAEHCPLEDGVLDLGCGSAVFLLDLAANREGRFLGIDYSEVAVALAANVGQKRGLSQVRFCHAVRDATRGPGGAVRPRARQGHLRRVHARGRPMRGPLRGVGARGAEARGVFVITTCNSTADEVIRPIYRAGLRREGPRALPDVRIRREEGRGRRDGRAGLCCFGWGVRPSTSFRHVGASRRDEGQPDLPLRYFFVEGHARHARRAASSTRTSKPNLSRGPARAFVGAAHVTSTSKGTRSTHDRRAGSRVLDAHVEAQPIETLHARALHRRAAQRRGPWRARILH